MTSRALRSQLERVEAMLAAGWRGEAGQSFRARHTRQLASELDEFDRTCSIWMSELNRILDELP